MSGPWISAATFKTSNSCSNISQPVWQTQTHRAVSLTCKDVIFFNHFEYIWDLTAQRSSLDENTHWWFVFSYHKDYRQSSSIRIKGSFTQCTGRQRHGNILMSTQQNKIMSNGRRLAATIGVIEPVSNKSNILLSQTENKEHRCDFYSLSWRLGVVMNIVLNSLFILFSYCPIMVTPDQFLCVGDWCLWGYYVV